MVFKLESLTWCLDFLRFRLFVPQCRKNLARDKLIGKKQVYVRDASCQARRLCPEGQVGYSFITQGECSGKRRPLPPSSSSRSSLYPGRGYLTIQGQTGVNRKMLPESGFLFTELKDELLKHTSSKQAKSLLQESKQLPAQTLGRGRAPFLPHPVSELGAICLPVIKPFAYLLPVCLRSSLFGSVNKNLDSSNIFLVCSQPQHCGQGCAVTGWMSSCDTGVQCQEATFSHSSMDGKADILISTGLQPLSSFGRCQTLKMWEEETKDLLVVSNTSLTPKDACCFRAIQ